MPSLNGMKTGTTSTLQGLSTEWCSVLERQLNAASAEKVDLLCGSADQRRTLTDSVFMVAVTFKGEKGRSKPYVLGVRHQAVGGMGFATRMGVVYLELLSELYASGQL